MTKEEMDKIRFKVQIAVICICVAMIFVSEDSPGWVIAALGWLVASLDD